MLPPRSVCCIWDTPAHKLESGTEPRIERSVKTALFGVGKFRIQTGQRLGRFAGAVAEKAVPLPSAVRHSELLTRWGACHANAILVTIDLRERVVGDEWLSATTEPIRARMNETPLALAFATSPGAYRGRV